MKESFKLALAQTTVSEDRRQNRSKGLESVARAAEAGAELVGFPEMAFDPFFPQYPGNAEYFQWAERLDGPTCQSFAQAARQHSIAVVINILQVMARGQYFDASVVLAENGRVAGHSHMMHICETPGFHEKYYYWPGTTDFPVFDVNGAWIAPCICYDRHFPEVMRTFTLRGADVILVQTATSKGEAGTVLEAEMQAAALANGVFVALVNRAGKDGGIDFAGRSFVVNPMGEIINQSEIAEDDLLLTELNLGEIEKARQAWPFLRDRRPETYYSLVDELEEE